MFLNYLKIAWRNLSKNSLYAAVNILGLSIGMTACLLLWQYVNFEKSYDQFHQNKDRLYRVAMFKYEKDEPEQSFAFTYPAVAPNLMKDFPEIEAAIRMRRVGFVMKFEDKVYTESPYFVDESFLEMFSFPLLQGDPATALEGTNSIVITERTAKKYFGEASAMDQTLLLENDGGFLPFKVSAVMQDLPENSHMNFDILMPYKLYASYVAQNGGDAENNWGWSDFYTYILLKPEADAAAVSAKLPAFIRQYKGEEFDQFGFEIALQLQALPAIYLQSDLGYEMRVNGNARYVTFLGIMALFILLIAWVNYINLSTARSIDRAREVGVRKVSGANTRSINPSISTGDRGSKCVSLFPGH
ncbi:MAG: ABC transporter permease [Saprospiraceae bacterium]